VANIIIRIRITNRKTYLVLIDFGGSS
jgi:hypothetical protein